MWKYRALVYSKELYTDLKSKFADIATYIAGLSDDEAKSFIAGVMDVEGTVTDRVVIYNGNRSLLEAIRQRIEVMGIQYTNIYKFGTIEGLQIYRRESREKFTREIPSVKLRSNKKRMDR